MIVTEGPPVEETDPAAGGVSAFPGGFQPEQLVSPGGLSSTINLMVVLTVLSLAPSILIMTTCFIRFIIVTSLLRQLRLPLDERGRRRAANRAEWFHSVDRPLEVHDIIGA